MPDTNLPRIWDGTQYVDGPPAPGLSPSGGGVSAQQLSDAVAGLAPLASPHFTGTPLVNGAPIGSGGGGGGVTPVEAGAWTTGATYAAGAVSTHSGQRYECALGHTAGTFATDLAAGKWVLLGVDPASSVSLPSNAAGWLHNDGAGGLAYSTPTPTDTGGVAKAGDTMTGPLVLPGSPASSLQAATKGYVDGAVGAVVGSLTPVGFPLYMPSAVSTGRATSIGGASGNLSSSLTANGDGFLVPFYVERSATFVLGLKCTTAGSAGALARLGVWNGGNGYPGTLFNDLGTITATAVDSIGPAQYTTATVALVAGTRYWVGVALQGAPTTKPIFGATVQPPWAVMVNGIGEGFTLKMTGQTGAFADNPVGTLLSAMTPAFQGTNMPRVFFKEQ